MRIGRNQESIGPYERQILPSTDVNVAPSLPEEKSSPIPQVGEDPKYAAFGKSIDVIFDISQRMKDVERSEERQKAEIELSDRFNQAKIDFMNDPKYSTYNAEELVSRWNNISVGIRDDVNSKLKSKSNVNFITQSWLANNNNQTTKLTSDGWKNTIERQAALREKTLISYSNDYISSDGKNTYPLVKVNELFNEAVNSGLISREQADLEIAAWVSDTKAKTYQKNIFGFSQGYIDNDYSSFERNKNILMDSIKNDADIEESKKKVLLDQLDSAFKEGSRVSEEYLAAKEDAQLSHIARFGETDSNKLIEEEILGKKGKIYFNDVYLVRKDVALNSFKHRTSAGEKFQIKENIKNSLESIRRTGIPMAGLENDIADSMTEKDLQKYKLDKEVAMSEFIINDTISRQSLEADAKYLESIKPKSEKNDPDSFKNFKGKQILYDKALVKVREKYKTLMTDPVSWITKTNIERQFISGQEDPLLLSKTDEVSLIKDIDDPAAMKEYINVLLKEENMLGVPDNRTKILSKREAQDMVNSLMSMPIEEQGKGLSNLTTLYGEYSKRLFKELKDAKLPEHYFVAAEITDPILQGKVIKAGAMKDEDFRNMVASFGEDYNYINNNVIESVSSNLEDWYDTVNAEGNDQENISLIMNKTDVIKKTVLLEAMIKNDINGYVDIAEEMTDTIINSKFDYYIPGFFGNDDSRYRHPKNIGASILKKRSAVMGGIKNGSIKLHSSMDNEKKFMFGWLWTNNGDDEIILKTKDGIPVLDDKNTEIKITFSE